MKTFNRTIAVVAAAAGLFLSAIHPASAINWTGGIGTWAQTVPPDSDGWDTAIPTTTQRAFLDADGGTPDNVTIPNGYTAEPREVRMDSGSSFTVAAGGTLITQGNDGTRSVYVGNFGQDSTMVVDGAVYGNSGRLTVGGFGTNDERSGTLTINDGAYVEGHAMYIRNNSTVYMEGGTLDVRGRNGLQDLIVETQQQNVGFGLADNKGWLEINGGHVITDNIQIREDSEGKMTGGLLTANRMEVGRNNQSQTAVFTQEGGYIDIGNDLVLSYQNGAQTADGIYNLDGGTLDVAATVLVANGTSGDGTFNLNGGTLKIDRITINNGNESDNTFNWTSGIVTKSEFFDEQIKINGHSSAGDMITIGDGIGSNDSILDLGNSYLNAGTRQTYLDGDNEPALDLKSDSQLRAVGQMLLHRQGGVGDNTSGSIVLLREFNDGITGTFGSFAGAGTAQFSGDPSTILSPADLPVETILLVYVNNAGDHHLEPGFSGLVTGVQLWYNIQGSVPEPSTVAFFVMGTALLRLTRSRQFLGGKRHAA